MFWSRPKPRWFIDPSKVAFGSVVELRIRNLSRSHVKVSYGGTHAQFIPLGSFMRRCQKSIRNGHTLGIEHLRVAPVLKQRHARFFDSLTDWRPATRRARKSPRHQAQEIFSP